MNTAASSCQIELNDLARLWDVAPISFPNQCIDGLSALCTRYRQLEPMERDAHVLNVIKRLTDRKLARATPENLQVFEAGWMENYHACLERGVSLETLRPKYVKSYQILRYADNYISPEDPFLLDGLIGLATTYSFLTYLEPTKHVYEFGCGSGRYIFELSELFPDKLLTGLDWTRASQRILGLIAESGRKVQGLSFDMLKPSSDIRLDAGAAVLTVGAMEQLGSSFQPFLEYLLANRPSIVVHHEPIAEFYDNESLYDYLALWYHRERDYLSGYWTALKSLEAEGRIEILAAHRLHFGDPFNDPESLVVWRPLP